MKVRLFLDEDVHYVLASALRKRGYDARHTGEEGRSGAADEEQLEFATRRGRCLMTFNVGQFAQLHNSWLESGVYAVRRANGE
jgi:predicted nuclease of predicted toxin-antitoxin system